MHTLLAYNFLMNGPM